MADQKKGGDLQSFQIGGVPGTGGSRMPVASGSSLASGTSQATAQVEAENAPSGVFPHLEELIERPDTEVMAFGQSMGEVCTKLDELIEKRSGRVKEEAKKARQAYELTFDMIDHLREIKAGLLQGDTPEE